MLCSIRKIDGTKVFAHESIKTDGPFVCPACSLDLNLRKGNIKVHHFAHKTPFNCTYGAGESETHRLCKETIFKALNNQVNVADVDMEVNFNSVVSDIYCKINNHPVAIEIQRSNISVNEIRTRTIHYESKGIHVLWLALYNKNIESNKYSPKAWEKWCHAAYYGRVFYWVSGLNVLPVHYSDYETYVEPSSWYDESGCERSGGDYWKTSKRFKTPCSSPVVNIAEDFQPSRKAAWRGGTVDVPECLLYVNNAKKWW